MDERQKMIDKVSAIYREAIDGGNKIRTEMQYIKEMMRNPAITHSEYVRLESRLKSLDSSYNVQLHITQGISLAREALFYDN